MNISVIRELLERRHMRPVDLSNETGIPFATISRILNGVITDPKVSTARRIAEVLKVKIDEII